MICKCGSDTIDRENTINKGEHILRYKECKSGRCARAGEFMYFHKGSLIVKGEEARKAFNNVA